MPKIHSLSISGHMQADWDAECTSGYYSLRRPSDIPQLVPDSLHRKFDAAVVINLGHYHVVVYDRVDGREIDQHPVGFFHSSGSQIATLFLLEHGSWSGRTISAS